MVSGQETVYMTSTDGKTFTNPVRALPAAWDVDPLRYYAGATTYFRTVRTPHGYAGVFQGNTLVINQQVGSVTTAAGLATSPDGLTWQISPVPVVTHAPGTIGNYAPCIFRVGAVWVVMGFNKARKTFEMWTSTELRPGTFRRTGDLTIPIPAGYATIGAPTVLWIDGALHLFYAGAEPYNAVPVIEGTLSTIFHTVLEWEAA